MELGRHLKLLSQQFMCNITGVWSRFRVKESVRSNQIWERLWSYIKLIRFSSGMDIGYTIRKVQNGCRATKEKQNYFHLYSISCLSILPHSHLLLPEAAQEKYYLFMASPEFWVILKSVQPDNPLGKVSFSLLFLPSMLENCLVFIPWNICWMTLLFFLWVIK